MSALTDMVHKDWALSSLSNSDLNYTTPSHRFSDTSLSLLHSSWKKHSYHASAPILRFFILFVQGMYSYPLLDCVVLVKKIDFQVHALAFLPNYTCTFCNLGEVGCSVSFGFSSFTTAFLVIRLYHSFLLWLEPHRIQLKSFSHSFLYPSPGISKTSHNIPNHDGNISNQHSHLKLQPRQSSLVLLNSYNPLEKNPSASPYMF